MPKSTAKLASEPRASFTFPIAPGIQRFLDTYEKLVAADADLAHWSADHEQRAGKLQLACLDADPDVAADVAAVASLSVQVDIAAGKRDGAQLQCDTLADLLPRTFNTALGEIRHVGNARRDIMLRSAEREYLSKHPHPLAGEDFRKSGTWSQIKVLAEDFPKLPSACMGPSLISGFGLWIARLREAYDFLNEYGEGMPSAVEREQLAEA